MWSKMQRTEIEPVIKNILRVIFSLYFAQSQRAIEIYNFIRLITMSKVDIARPSQLTCSI
jgi:hypothetical protein